MTHNNDGLLSLTVRSSVDKDDNRYSGSKKYFSECGALISKGSVRSAQQSDRTHLNLALERLKE